MRSKLKKIFLFIKKECTTYASTNILFLSYIIFGILIDVILRCLTGGDALSFKPFLADLAFLLIVGSFGYLIKPKNQFIYFFIGTLLNAIIAIINIIYYEFYESFISINLLATASMIGAVDDSLYQKLNLCQFMFLIFPILLIIIHVILKKKKYYIINADEKRKKKFKLTLSTGFGALIILACTLNGTDYSRLFKQWNREYIAQSLGIYIYHVNDIVQSVQPKLNSMFGFDKSYKVFKDFYEEKSKEIITENKYTDIFKGKNVIFIHGESIQNFLINLKINGNEVTPNLNKLVSGGMYFSSFYPQISVGTSSDTEFTLSTGLLPSSSGTVFVSYADREYETIQKSFKSLGYYTFSMHGNDAYYWNRKVMHANLGYEKFYARDFFNVTEENSFGLGISDKAFFEQIMPVLKEKHDAQEPFMSTIITLSNHSSFNELDKYGPFDVSMPYVDSETAEEKIAPYLEGTYMGNYLKSVHYADSALGQFMDSLEADGILEDTVIVFYGDHEARLSKNQFNMLYNYNPQTQSLLDKDDESFIEMDNYKYDLIKNTPLIIYSKNDKIHAEIKDVMGMYDVYPTIGNMFGFTSTFALGNDIFSKKEKIVVFPNGDFITNSVYYNNLNDEYVLLNDNPIDAEYIQEYKNYSSVRLEVSNAIIYHNLINYYKSREKEI